ncbi:MAG: hypothetical protein ACWGNB_06050 [Thiogranum sp.]
MSLLTTKRILLALLLVPAVLLLAGLAVIALVDDATLVSWVVRGVESASGTQITYRQPARLTRGFAPELQFEALEIVDSQQSFHVASDSLDIQVSLPALLIGRLDVLHLVLGNTRIQVLRASGGGGGLSVDPKLFWFKPVLHQVRLAGLSLSAQDRDWKIPSGTISELSLQLASDDATPELSADVKVLADVLHIDATLPAFFRTERNQSLPFAVSVKGALADAEFKGQADFAPAGARIDAQLQLHSGDLSRLSAAVDGLRVPGELMFTAVVSGPFEQLAVSDIKGEWNGPDHSTAQIDGRIDKLLELGGIHIKLDADIQKPDWLSGQLPDSLAPIARAGVKATLTGSRERLAVGDFKLDAETAEQLKIDVGGRFELAQQAGGGLAAEHIAADLAFEAPTTRAARGLLFDNVPEFGAITGRADIRSSDGPPAFENVAIATQDGRGTSVKLNGTIRQFPLSPDEPNRGYALNVAIAAKNARAALGAVGLELPLGGPLDLGFRIEGDTPALELNAIRLVAGTGKAVLIKAGGGLRFGDWAQQDPLKDIDLEVEGYSHSTAALSTLTGGGTLPELGALQAHTRVRTVSGKHQLDDFSLSTVKGAALQVALTGSASRLDVMPKPALSGIQLELVGKGGDTAALNRLFNLRGDLIPPAGAFELRSRITGSDQAITIGETHVVAGEKSVLQVSLHGRVGRLDARGGWTLHGTDLQLEAAADSSQALAKAEGYRLPPLGPLSASAAIKDKNAKLALEDLHLRIASAGRVPAITAFGRIDDLSAFRDVDIDVMLNIDGHNLAAFADRQTIEDLAPLTGSMRIADSNGVVGMQSLRLRSEDPALHVDINGSFADFGKPQTLKLNAEVRARDLALVGALFDQVWPAFGPLDITGDLGRDGNLTKLALTVKAGPKDLEANLHGNFDTDPPRFAGKITLHELALPEFFQKVADRRAERKKAAKKITQPLFSREPIDFAWLKTFDLNLGVHVASFDPAYSPARSADMTVTVQSGLLTVDPVVVTYPKGNLKLALSVDARDKPQLTFSAYGKDIDPWRDMRGWTQPNEAGFGADLDVDIHLDASGNSVYGLVSSLDGNVFMTSRHGKIHRSIVDLLFVDIAGWAASKINDSKYLDITCGVADFAVKNGVASTRAFFLDTKNIAITGDGDIDFGKERVNYVFIPKKKSRLILKAEPVKVKGPLLDPSVTAIPVKSAALTFGTLLFAPYVFVGLTASGYIKEKFGAETDDTPCLTYERTRDVPDNVLDLPAKQ